MRAFYTKLIVGIVVLCLLIGMCGCAKKSVKNKFKNKVDSKGYVHNKNLVQKYIAKNSTSQEKRGFFTPGLLSLGKVLNFFPVGGERECQPSEYTVARAGICLNAYDCRQRDGKAAGDCAHGLGVCCVFEVTCGGTVQNNLTYFMSPGFPELWGGDKDCNITIEKTHQGITQLRIDFVHFTIGQPNRTTGECDEDAMILGEGDNKIVICGQNHGQHLYYTFGSGTESREAGGLAGAMGTRLSIRVGVDAPRVWLARLAQLPLASAAPHACRQYYTADNGTIKTFNFASNGRYLAGQKYRACIRRNTGFCAVRYEPCDRRSFRIGPGTNEPAGVMQQEQLMPADVQMQDDEIEGSGSEPNETPAIDAEPVAPPSIASRIWSFIWPSWLWGQARAARPTPYAALTLGALRYYGYGYGGVGLRGHGRQQCTDRITVPCENEYFVSSSSYLPGVCDPHHCGDSFCPGIPHQNCRVESSITPFAISVNFGPPTVKNNPEENTGACLRYTQLPCES